MNIHFVGIGGIGISALAQFCVKRGDRVTGSDLQESVITDKLREQGIKVFMPQKKENVPRDTDLMVYSEAVDEKNPERQYAKEKNIPQKSYFEYLGEVSQKYRVIAVCGTHGKTTTTAMIGHGFLKINFDATVIVGTTVKEWGDTNFHAGTNEWLVVEACEYRNNFRFLHPEIVVLTDLDHDHPDSFPTEDSYWQAFSDFCAKAKTVIFHDNKKSQRVLEGHKGQKIPVNDSEIIPLDYAFGEHNQRNARLVVAVFSLLLPDTNPSPDLNSKVRTLGKFQKALEDFRTPGRRQDYLGEINGVKIYDDYAHHPAELDALIEAFRGKFPKAKLAMIFEPHQFSRTKEFLNEFAEVLRKVDILGIMPIYAARDTDEDKKIMPVEKLIALIPGAMLIKSEKDVSKITSSQLHAGDLLVFAGAGYVSDFAHLLVKPPSHFLHSHKSLEASHPPNE